MTVLILGAGGQLGRAFLSELPGAIGLGRADLDVTDERAVRDAVVRVSPRLVVNCAAYTDVDGAESNADLAFAVNGMAAGHIAAVCAEIGSGFLTFSTDYVFDGVAERYVESSVPNPINVYGASKLAGEIAVLEAFPESLVVRTSWLISATHPNFVKTILDLASRGAVRVVNDQWGQATCAADLAKSSLQAIERGAGGLLHLTNRGVLTWFDLARRAITLAGLEPESVQPCTTAEFPRPARRPVRSVLESERLEALGLDPLPYIDASLPGVVAGLAQAKRSSK